ncbi:enoyl-CoA hydratase/isomerase family protein [Streptomyces fulvorobeus]|uniref:enoyl-CoA hydratase n=1 Tax=Streptomyces fulvorobeus TaxID=284028 RepID=A0A7J0C9M0_9ACTN|nr:enoyl-CoA hydratase/isomerase family protein [Streptomyces fulvorobeus]NYE42729.1 enoyl-CoA hydratase [Streptomyces fulvorobeus]GFM99142.1 enoyl-CoA hydratase [Streptomyces fulvorobeus]
MTVRVGYEDAVAWVCLDQPPLNLFDTSQQLAAEGALRELEARDGLRAVVFTGAHGHFSAGGDVKEMGSLPAEEVAGYADRISRLTRRVAALPVPVIAAVEGFALGGGCELALAADVRLCTPTARFALPETPLGLIPGAGGTQRLPRLIGLSRAKDIIFSGRMVHADEAARIGLVDAVVPEKELVGTARAWSLRYTACPAGALAAAKQAVDASAQGPLEAGLDLERALFAPLLAAGERTEHFRGFQGSRTEANASAR